MRGRLWNVLRWAFVVAVVVGAWWSWRDSGEELERALGRLSLGAVAVGAVLVLLGLALSGLVWRTALASFAADGPAREVVPPFFVAQLGKYIPGSVWTFAVQGALGARRGLPPRVPVAAAVLFLGVHVASGLLLTGVVGWWTELPAWVVAASLVVGLVGLVPAVHRLVGRRVAGVPCDWGLGHSLRGALVMTVLWSLYAVALTALAPGSGATALLTLGCAFAVAHAVGVAVPIAPAGLGAREAAFIVLVAPVLGAGPAGALAVVFRLLHTVADFLLAGVSSLLMRASGARQPSGPPVDDH
ncbi:lysylphosphatidylglycerol synthase domain-containing protein [Nocardioides sp.]|uniref:lysylphosphatidylglycerol synthase domain-containing protein n=1 Tax=Nocardioides sp. TaxID=35761 RepID=UPI0035B45240